MDHVNRSFYLTRLAPTVTADHLRKLLSGLNQEGQIVADDSIKITLFPAGSINTTVNAVITGVNLSIREIEERLVGKVIEKGPFIIRFPDFGVDRDGAGNILHSRFHEQIRMMEAVGFLKPVDIFEDDFLLKYGDYSDLKNVTHINGTKKLWNLSPESKSMLQTSQYGLLKYGSTLNPKNHNYYKLNLGESKFEYDTTELWFASRLQCFQAARQFNNNPVLMSQFNIEHQHELPRFITGPPTEMFCSFDAPFENLGIGNRIIDPRENPHFVVDLWDLQRVSEEKCRSFEFECPVCNVNIQGWGVDGDLSWLAGCCECALDVMKDRGLIHGGAEFLRVAKHALSHNTPFALMQATLPTYPTVPDCESRELPCVLEENRISNESLAADSAVCRFNFHELSETLVLHDKMTDIYIGQAIIPTNKTWRPDGASKIDKLTFRSESSKDEDVKFRGKLYDITFVNGDENMAELWFEFYLPHGSTFDSKREYRVTPISPANTTRSIAKAFSTWRDNERLYTNVFTDYIGCLQNTKCREQLDQTPLEKMWIADVYFPSDSIFLAIKEHLEHGFVGMDTKMTVMENGKSLVYGDFARVIDIKYGDTREISVFTIAFRLRHSITLRNFTKFSCKIWAYDLSPEEKEKKKTNNLEKLVEDNIVSLNECTPYQSISYALSDNVAGVDIGMIMEDDPDYGDNEGSNLEECDELTRRKKRRDAQEQQEESDELTTHKYCLSYRLQKSPPRISVHSSLSDILGFKKGSPVPNVNLGNVLIHEQNITSLQSTRTPKKPSSQGRGRIRALKNQCDPSQYAAIKKFLQSTVSVIQGPAGTGKTHTAALAVLALLCKEIGYVIACTPTDHSATVLFRLIMFFITAMEIDINVIMMVPLSEERFNTREEPYAQCFLHLALENDPDYVRFCQQNTFDGNNENEHEGVFSHGLSSKEKDRLAKIWFGSKLLTKADIIVCTAESMTDVRITGMQKLLVDTERRLLAVVCDDASLITAPLTVPMLNLAARRLLLIGDNSGLTPTLKSPAAILALCNMSIMKKISMTDYMKNNKLSSLLKTHYRSEVNIGQIFSNYMYIEELEASFEVQRRSKVFYPQLTRQLNLPELSRGHTVVHTYTRRSEIQGVLSKVNPSEVALTVKLILHLKSTGYSLRSIGVITMYEGQVHAIRRALYNQDPEFENVVVVTVDDCAATVFELAIISMVRSNDLHHVGSLRNLNRIYVAISRACHYNFILCDMITMMGSSERSIRRLLREWIRLNISVVIHSVDPNGAVDRLLDTDMLSFIRANR